MFRAVGLFGHLCVTNTHVINVIIIIIIIIIIAATEVYRLIVLRPIIDHRRTLSSWADGVEYYCSVIQ